MSKDEERLEFLKSYENKLIAEGTKLIVGIDEAGRGPLAGPVSVAAVIMKPESNLKWVNDSKKVTEKRREVLYDQIIEDAIVWDVEIVTQSEIDEYNILEATKIGLNRCIKKIIDKLGKKPELILVDALKEIVPDVNIEDLPIPYAAVATDWNSGKEVVFKKGSLYEAVRSSISIPLFFNPVRKGEMLLVDGGLVNGLPLNRVARVKGDLLVGVNVSTHDYKEEKLMSDIIDKKTLAKSLPAAIVKRIMDYQEGLGLNYMTLLSRTISIMLEQNTRQQIIISKPDIAVQVQMKRYGGNDYDKAAEISLIGENKMRKALNEYEQAHASIWDQLKSFGK